jgi:hypothetical protein
VRSLRETVKLVERPSLATLQDDFHARQPIGPLTVNQMADNINGTPGFAAFVGYDPTIGKFS